MFLDATAQAALVRSEEVSPVELLKDLVSKGDPTSQGIGRVKASGYRVDHDRFYVERMRDAGIRPHRQTNLPEMGGSLSSP